MHTNNKFFFITFLLGMLLFSAVSCNEDPDFVEPFPDVQINLGEIKDLYYYNETLSLSPTINYEGGDASDFTYQWSLVANDEIVPISDDLDLDFVLNEIGSYILYFEATNTSTDVTGYVTAVINVESLTNQGWYVLKETSAGDTDMDGFYMGVDNPDYNIIESQTGKALAGAPKALLFSTYYKTKDTTAYGGYASTAAILPFSENGGLAYDVSNAKPISNLEDMFFLQPENSDQSINSGFGNGGTLMVSAGDKAYSMNDGNPAFFPAIPGDYEFNGFYTGASYGNSLAFDSKSKSFVMLTAAGYATSDTIAHFADAYGEFNEGLKISVNNMNGDVVFLENTVSGSGWSSTVYAYSLFKENGAGNDLSLLGIDYNKFVKGYYYHYPVPGDYSNYTLVRAGEYSPINFQRTLAAADYPELTGAELFAMNKATKVLYFVNGTNIGLYNIATESYQPSFISDIPAGEEITFMKHITCNYESSDFDFDGLAIATYSSGSDTYQVYFYQLEGLSTVTKKENVLTGSGKAARLMYVSASSYSWSSDLYKYY